MAVLGFELLLKLLWGWFFVLIWIRRTESSEKFVKISFRIVVGTSLVTFLLPLSQFGVEAGFWGSSATLALLTLGHFFYTYFYQVKLRVLGFITALVAPMAYFLWGNPPPPQSILIYIEFVSASLLLGGVFVSQFLGHWVLNVPGMEIRELKRVLYFFFAGLFIKTLLILPFLSKAFLFPSEDGLSIDTFSVIILTSRCLWGILAPWVLGVMAFQTVKMRSTQSATGILYALSVMILLGEGSALFLRISLGWVQ